MIQLERAAYNFDFHTGSTTKKKRDHAPAAAAVAGITTQAAEENWHCPVCWQSHATECVVCGEAGDDDTRLVPCDRCPRAFHARCAELVSGSDGKRRCRACVVDEAAPTTLAQALQPDVLKQIEVCAPSSRGTTSRRSSATASSASGSSRPKRPRPRPTRSRASTRPRPSSRDCTS